MKIVVLDGYAANPGDLSWEGMKVLGECTIYDRTAPEEVLERAAGAEAILTNKVIIPTFAALLFQVDHPQFLSGMTDIGIGLLVISHVFPFTDILFKTPLFPFFIGLRFNVWLLPPPPADSCSLLHFHIPNQL